MSAARKRNNFLVQGGILAVASIMVRIIGLLYRIPMANIIGEAGMGYYSVAYEIYNIVLILSSYSLPLAVSKLVAVRTAKKEYRNAYKIFLGAMSFAIVVGLVAALIIYFGSDLLATLFGYPQAAIPLRILAPAIFILAVLGVLRGYFQGKNTMMPTAISQILEQIINAVVSIFAAYYFMKQHSASVNIAAYGAAGGTLGTCLGALFALLFLLFVFTLYYPTIKKQRQRDKGSVKESYQDIYKALAITIVPVILSQAVYQLSGSVDSALFGNIMAAKGFPEEIRSGLLGVYSNKYRLLVNVPIAISSAFAASIIPSIANAFSRQAMAEVKNKIHVTIKVNMIIAIPSAVGLGVLAKPIIDLLFPGSEPLAHQLLQMGSVAVVFFALSTVSNAVLQGINKMKIPVTHSAISLGVHAVIVYVLLQHFNLSAFGLVIGNVTFALLVCILNWVSIGRLLNYKQEIFKTFLIPTVSAAVMGVGAWLAYGGIHKALHSNAISTVITIIIAVIIYFVCLLLFKGLTENELNGMPMGRAVVKIARKLHLLK